MVDFKQAVEAAETLPSDLFLKDFLLTWNQTVDELKKILHLAEALRMLHRRNLSARCFESGLAVSIFRDHSTRTRFSFASAANLLGLSDQDLDEGKSQIAHGETVRETANMISFLTEVIGIRDDIFIGMGHAYMREVAEAVENGFREDVLQQRPSVINLQCDMDHPTQSMADLLHLKNHFGSFAALKGKKIAMSWAYSPSYGKPLSVPQGIIALMTRFGMDVTLAYPEGYHLIPDTVEIAQKNARESGGRFSVAHSMDEAFEGAHVVYPKSWAPFSVMEQRTELLKRNDQKGLQELEKACLSQNAAHINWECTEEKMKRTNGGQALYMHCLPADISKVSCEQGEVQDRVFEKYRIATYIEAGYKPFVIASIMLNARFKDPVSVLRELENRNTKRVGDV